VICLDELARVRAVAIAALEAARVEHTRWCLRYVRDAKSCDCGANEHNRKIDAAIAEIGGNGGD
jgi:hypothetical protein